MGSSESKVWRECDISSWDAEALTKLKDEVKKKKKKKLNILLFGMQAQGKSAFINTVFSALHGRQKAIAAEALDGAGSTTQGVRKHPLKEVDGPTTWNLSLFDMRGLQCSDDEDNIKNDLKYILDKGDFPPKAPDTLSVETPVQALVVCNSYTDNFKLCDNSICEYMKVAYSKEIPVFLLITKIDTSHKDFKISSVFSDKEMLRATQEAAKKFGIPEKNVLLQCNYSGVNHCVNKNDIDILTLYNLLSILSKIEK